MARPPWLRRANGDGGRRDRWTARPPAAAAPARKRARTHPASTAATAAGLVVAVVSLTDAIPSPGNEAALEQDAPALAPIRWRRGQCANARRQSPLLDVGLDEDEAGLAEVDVDGRRPARADAREEVEALEADEAVLMLTAVAREEDGSGPRPVADTEDVALAQRWAVRMGGERVVVRPEAIGAVRDRVPAEA
jgi:hypothetical protein